MNKLIVLSTMMASATAFAPSGNTIAQSSSVLFSSEEDAAEAAPAAPTVAPINGWTADASLPCFGLPGVVSPTGFFDPLGFAQDGITVNEVKRNRESEVMHGRVAMLATVGYLSGEAISGPFQMQGPANDQLQQMPLPAFALLTVGIAAAELKRAQIGWVEPNTSDWEETLWTLRDTYYPGDIGFDPLGLKPDNAADFAKMQTKELQNGRLAMLGIAGMCAQELVNHRGIFETLDYYQKVYSGVDPYVTCGAYNIC